MNVTFTGDINISGFFTKKVTENIEIFSKEISAELTNNDFVIGNLEGPATDSPVISNKNMGLKSPRNTINYLKNKNISVFNLANNHVFDCGEIGMLDTFKNISDADSHYFGANYSKQKVIKPLIISKEGVNVALFGIAKTTPSHINNIHIFSSNDISILKKQIKRYRHKVNYVVVNFHGGEEYTRYPSPPKRKLLRKIAKLKYVDIIISHHSHTFQGYEKVNNTHIFYSLGNFIFDIPIHKMYPHTNKAALLKFNFTKNQFKFNFIPFLIKNETVTYNNSSHFQKDIIELSNFTNYRKKWQKEAYRVLFRKNNPNLNKIEPSESLQNKSLIFLFLSKKFYLKSFQVLKDQNMRSLYSNAILFKLKKYFVS